MIKRITQNLDGTIVEEFFPEPILDADGNVQFDENGEIILDTIPE